MKKLPVEFKEQWLAALRSGNYNQTSGYMKRDDAFCCLGVAYNILHKEKEDNGWIKPPVSFGRGNVFYTSVGKAYLPGEGDYPSDVWEALVQDVFPMTSWLTHLSNMNDSGKTFDEIADLIEKSL